MFAQSRKRRVSHVNNIHVKPNVNKAHPPRAQGLADLQKFGKSLKKQTVSANRHGSLMGDVTFV